MRLLPWLCPLLGLGALACGDSIRAASNEATPTPGPDASAPPSPTPAPAALGDAIFQSTIRLWQPHFQGIDESGILASRGLGPDRPQGYGGGEGTLRLETVAPGGDRIAVVFENLERRAALFVLALDGTLTSIANDSEHIRGVVWHPEGECLLYIAGNGLYEAPADGSASPRLLAEGVENWPIGSERYRFLDTQVVFERQGNFQSGGGSRLYYAARDGSDAADAPQLTTPTNRSHHLRGVLPDGRALISLGEGPLWAGRPGEALQRLTPEDAWHRQVHIVEEGTRLVLALATNSSGGDETLVSVATDGSEADAPRRFGEEAYRDTDVTVGEAGVFAALYDGRSWEMRYFPGFTGGTGTRLAGGYASRPFIGHPLPGDAATIGCDDAGAVLRFDRARAAAEQLAPADDLPGCFVQGLAGPEASHVIFMRRDAMGELRPHAVPSAGGEVTALGLGAVRGVGPAGVLLLPNPADRHRFYRSIAGGTPAPLSVEHHGVMHSARLVDEAQTLLYAADAPEPGWYAAAVDGADADQPRRIADAAPDTQPLGVWSHWLLTREGEEIVAWDIEASTPAPRVVHRGFGVAGLFEDIGWLAVVSAQQLDLHDLAGDAHFEHQTSGELASLRWHPHLGRFVAITRRTPETPEGIDSFPAGPPEAHPRPLIPEGVGLPMHIDVIPGDPRIFVTVATDFTAIPHPQQVFVVDPTRGEDAQPLAARGHLLFGGWSAGDFPSPLGPPPLRPWLRDVAVLMAGGGALSAASYDSPRDRDPQPLVTTSTLPRVAPGRPAMRDGRLPVMLDSTPYLLHWSDDATLTPLLELDREPVSRIAWTPDGDGLLIHVGTDFEEGRLMHVDLSGARPSARRVTEAHALVDLRPEGVIIRSRVGGDHSLYRVDLDSGELSPISPVDDAAERLIGFAAAQQ